jgi:hypothetical protein
MTNGDSGHNDAPLTRDDSWLPPSVSAPPAELAWENEGGNLSAGPRDFNRGTHRSTS